MEFNEAVGMAEDAYNTMQIRDLIEARARDLARDLLYYDRKEDEELPPGVIENAISEEDVHVGEIAEWFTEELMRSI